MVESKNIASSLHIGIIMDGNGRWAARRNLPRTYGYFEGLKATKKVIISACENKIRYLTLFVFSAENWKRPPHEVRFLMNLLTSYLRREHRFCNAMKVRIVHSGEMDKLPAKTLRALQFMEDMTEQNDELIVNLAVNYSGQEEILRAINRWSMNGSSHEKLDKTILRRYLDQPYFPDIDLVIRTGGEQRLSNFMLWECAYAELLFSEKLWPDWCQHDLNIALDEFKSRKRNFGSVCNE